MGRWNHGHLPRLVVVEVKQRWTFYEVCAGIMMGCAVLLMLRHESDAAIHAVIMGYLFVVLDELKKRD